MKNNALSSNATQAENQLLGVGSALVTIVIWASWLIATRYAMTSNFTAVDIGLIRFSVPFLFLAPVWIKKGVWPKGLSLFHGLVMLVGSGAFYTLLVASALRFVPASHVGILLPGVMAIWAIIIAILLYGERPGWVRCIGYGAVLVGIILLAWLKPAGMEDSHMFMGYGLVSIGAFLWACYTHAMRQSGIGALEAASFVGFWSFLIMVVVAFFTGTHIPQANTNDLLMLLLTQGLLAGFVAVVSYGLAVRHIGSTGASAFGAMTPALTAIGGVVLLGEASNLGLVFAVLLVIVGVMAAAGTFRRFIG